MLHGALLEVRSLSRLLGPWPLLGLGIWVLTCWIQEPRFLRGSGVAFFWESVYSALGMTVAAIPFLWVLTCSPASSAAVLRATVSPIRTVSINIVSISSYCLLVATATALFAGSLDLIGGRSGSRTWEAPVEACRFLAPLATLAPGIAHLGLSTTGRTIAWIGIVLVHIGLLGSPDPATALGDTAPPALLAAVAGLLLSTAVVTRRIST